MVRESLVSQTVRERRGRTRLPRREHGQESQRDPRSAFGGSSPARYRVKALLIGGTGPTGPHIINGLLVREYDVTLLHRGVHEPDGLPQVEHIHADPHFPETLREAVAGRDFDVVVASYGRLRQIAEVFRGRCRQLVGIGGTPVYGGFVEPENATPYGSRLLVREDGPLADASSPPSDFAMKLLSAERSLLDAAQSGAYQGTIVRYPQIYGPRNVIPWEWGVIKRVIDGRTRIILPDHGLWIQTRCAAANAAQAVLAVVDSPELADGRAFNCADRDQFTLRQWAELIVSMLGRQVEFVGIPSDLAPSAFMELLAPQARPHMLVDAHAIRDVLGCEEVIGAREALEETVAWLVEHPVSPEEYPAYPARFDYPAEDRLMDVYARAQQQVRELAPDAPLEMVHAMAHPKKPGLGVDDRGR